jgi:membrane dipeptidase
MRVFIILLSLTFLSCNGYRHLHRAATVIDTHNDVLSQVSLTGKNISTDLRGQSHSDVGRFMKSGLDAQFFSVFCDERFGKDTAYKLANIQIDSLEAIVRRHPKQLRMAYNSADIISIATSKRMACLIGVEGGHMIEDRLDYLDALYKRGTRYLTLTWNNSTSWATSAKDEEEGTAQKKGLNDFGKEVVQRMNSLGMLVDLSHAGEQTFWDVIAVTKAPVLVSHSCVHAICPFRRNLKDDQIRAVAKNGGVIHLNFYSGFLDSNFSKRRDAFFARHQKQVDSLKKAGMPSYEAEGWISGKYKKEAEALRPPLSLLLDHIDHIVRVGGIDHVGLGSDFDGITSTPLGLEDVTDFKKITKGLLDRGYSKKDVRKILGGNFLRLFAAVEAKANPLK